MASPRDGGERQRCEALLVRFKKWLATDPRHKRLYSEFQQITKSAGARALQVEDALFCIVKMHAEKDAVKAENNSRGSNEFKAFAYACLGTLQLMCSLQTLCNTVLEICRWFAPKKLSVVIDDAEDLVFVLHGMDDEGRAIYRAEGTALTPNEKYLRWHQPAGQRGFGRWALKTDEEGAHPGEYQLAAALATDSGAWVKQGSSERGHVVVEAAGEPVVHWRLVRELRDVAVTGRACGPAMGTEACEPPSVQEAAREVQRIVAGMNLDEELLGNLEKVLAALCDIAAMLEWKLPGWRSEQEAYDVKPKDSTLPELFQSLVSLSGMEGEDLLRHLGKQLPRYDQLPAYDERTHKKKSLVSQCMILNCRLLDLSDLHDVNASFLPRLVHRMSLWSWQRRLPLEAREERVVVEADQGGERVRFVAVSDTHAWDADIQLPEGDVLLHCGDLLFEAGHVHEGDELPNDILAMVNLFKTKRYQQFKWIFVVCGNHDQPIYDLWKAEPERLFELLPGNLVILQAHAHFGDHGQLPVSGAAKEKEVRACVEQGAIRLQPMRENGQIRLKVGKPSDKEAGGWVIAGTGVSLATNPWSSNRAFQLLKPSSDGEIERAARNLLCHDPDIVMTYGPPIATEHSSPDKGDSALLTKLKACKSWKVTLFGHIQEDHGRIVELEEEDGRPLVCTALCTPLFVPTRPPIVFTLGVVLSELNEVPVADDTPLLSKPAGPLEPGREDSCCGAAAALLRCCRCIFRLDRGGAEGSAADDEDLVAGWVPPNYVEPEVLKLLREKQEKAAEDALAEIRRMDQGSGEDEDRAWREDRARREAAKKVQLSEFHVSGPAVLYSFRSISLWGFNTLISLVGFQVTGDPAYYVGKGPCEGRREATSAHCKAFVDYPFWLWGGFVLVFVWAWKVQLKCLGYMMVPHAQLLAKAGRKRTRFKWWWWKMFILTGIANADVTSQCLFFAQFSRSVLSNPEIQRRWEKVAKQSLLRHVPCYSNISVLFTACWAMMFVQALHLILSTFADEDRGVSYDLESMPHGYSTMASSLLAVSVDSAPVGADLQEASRRRFFAQRCCAYSPFWGWRPLNPKYSKNWHADVLRTVARFGRMPALLDCAQERLEARLEQEMRRGLFVRYLQILCFRMKDDIFALLLLDILETAFKLEMQVSIFAMELSLDPVYRMPWQTRTIFQMHMAIFMSTFGVLYALWKHVKAFVSFRSMSFPEEGADFLNRDECQRNWNQIKCTLHWYLFLILVFSAFIVHSVTKLVMAYRCPSSLWNLGTGCVDVDDDAALVDVAAVS